MEKTNLAATDPPGAAVADKPHGNAPCGNKKVSTATNVSGSASQKKKTGPEGANSGPTTRASYRLSQESTSSEDVPISCLATRKGGAKAITRLSLKKAMTAVAAGLDKRRKKTPALPTTKTATKTKTKTTTAKKTTKKAPPEPAMPIVSPPATKPRTRATKPIAAAKARPVAARGTIMTANKKIEKLEEKLGASDQLLLHANSKMQQQENELTEAQDRIKRYEEEIRSLSSNLVTSVDNYEKVVEANQQLQVTLQIETSGNREKEAAIKAACEAEHNRKTQEIESNYAAEL